MIHAIDIPENCSITAIYEAASTAAGIDPEAVESWDCRKILVSNEIFDAYEAYMKEQGRELSIGALWLAVGPKISDNLHDGEVEIQDGFFTLKNEKESA